MPEKSAPNADNGYSWLLAEPGSRELHRAAKPGRQTLSNCTHPHDVARNADGTSTTSPKGLGSVGGRYAVYRFYDRAGTLLYVGRSMSLLSRLASHESEKVWWPDVAEIHAERFSTLEASKLRELHLIWALLPLHNIREKTDEPLGIWAA